MTNAMLDTRLLDPADWRILRDTRLRALSDSPDAFVSRYRRECRVSDDHWRQRLQAAAWVVAREHSDVIGMAGLIGDHLEEPVHVESTWVAPTHRNRGVFRSLLERVAEIARDVQLSVLWVWVLEDNPVAWRVYVRSGFVWTGERRPIGPGHDRFERCMRLTI